MSDVLMSIYGDFFVRSQQLRKDAGESDQISLQPNLVPKELVRLIPYAAFWGGLTTVAGSSWFS